MKVRLEDVRLSYAYKDVLKGVSLTFEPGRIHALLGENGAGKSSLFKILTGAVQPSGGKIFLDEEQVIFKKQPDSLKKGIACVYQRPFLADSLTVSENLRIGIRKPNENIHYILGEDALMRKKLMNSKVMQYFICGTEINLFQKAGELSGAERFFVAFSAALMRNPKVLILDEPTALLSELQSVSLFRKLRSLAESGVNVIVITHKESDLKFCDEKIVIVDGVIRKDKSLETGLPKEDEIIATKAFQKVHYSETDFQKYRQNGNVGIIPADKTYLASHPKLTVAQLLYPAVKNDTSGKSEKEIVDEIIEKAGITIKPEEKVINLSGGMLQRLILERELWNNPESLVLENPYQGLDSKSAESLKMRLENLKKNGVHIIE